MGSTAEGDEEASAPNRVILLAAVVSVVALALLFGTHWSHRPNDWWIVAGVGGLFLLGEFIPVSIEFRRESHTFSFTSVPFLIGLFFLSPQILVLSRLVASVIALGFVQRQPLFRLFTNLATHLVEVVTMAEVVGLLGPRLNLHPSGWLVLVAAVLTADLAGALLVTAAISVYQQRFEPSLLGGLWLGVLSTLADLAVALVVVTLMETHQAALWLMPFIAGFIVFLMRVYSKVKTRHQHIELLYDLNQELSEAVLNGEAIELLLRRTAEILHAEVVWLISRRPDGTVHLSASDPASASADIIVEMHDFCAGVLERLSGSTSAHLIKPDSSLGQELQANGYREAIVAPLNTRTDSSGALVVVDRSGSVRPFDGDDVTLFGTLALHANLALRNVDFVDRLRAENDRNEQLATHDSLTGLPNRSLIHRTLEQLLAAEVRVAVLLIDLDRFKDVNDTLGHDNGDRLLIEAGARMVAAVGPEDLIARLGGDEFAIIVRSAADPSDLRILADRLRADLSRPYRLADVEVEIGASVGIALPGPTATDAATLLRHADVAMYSAKADHLGTEIYTPARDHYSPQRLALVAQLRSAIEHHELQMHYQPLIHLGTGQLVGVEALVRWPQPGGGMVLPDEFIYIAEHTGLIRPLTRLVMSESIEQAGIWHRAGHPVRVSFNLSPRNLLEPDLAEEVAHQIAISGVPAASVQLEMTESTVMSDPQRTIEVLKRLRSTGVGIAIDDFGTGHSSLAYLTSLPATELKIDKTFVLAMMTDSASYTVVRSIIDLGRSLGLEVLAEGVETAEASEALHSMGCHLAQGYLYSRPLSPAAFETWMQSRPPSNFQQRPTSRGVRESSDRAASRTSFP